MLNIERLTDCRGLKYLEKLNSYIGNETIEILAYLLMPRSASYLERHFVLGRLES